MSIISFASKTRQKAVQAEKRLKSAEAKAYKKYYKQARLSLARKEASKDAKYGGKANRIISQGLNNLKSSINSQRRSSGLTVRFQSSQSNMWR